MFKLNRKRVLFLGGYLAFNLVMMVTCMRVFGRIGSAVGKIHFNLGEVLSHLWASLLPSPF